MIDIGIVGIVLMAVNIIASLAAFKDRNFFNTYSFDVGEIILRKDYKRMITSGFIHVDYTHLILNMLSFYFFAGVVENNLGPLQFFLLYMGSLVAGSLFSLWSNRSDFSYRAVGASGAVSGVIFASIALNPASWILLFMIIPIPGWAFALGFVAYSIFGMKNKRDNIGHDAHLGGALFGMFLSIYFRPEMIFENTLPIVLVTIPCLIYLILLFLGIDITKHNALKFKILAKSHKPEYYDVEDYYRDKKKRKEDELNHLLEKVSKSGMDSLTSKEKERLDSLSK